MTSVGFGQQGSQAVGLGFKSLSCQIFLRLIPNIFRYPKLVKHYRVPLRKFSALWDKKFTTENLYTPPSLIHNFFSIPEVLWNTESFPYEIFRHFETKNFPREIFILPTLLSINFFTTGNFLKPSTSIVQKDIWRRKPRMRRLNWISQKSDFSEKQKDIDTKSYYLNGVGTQEWKFNFVKNILRGIISGSTLEKI